MSFILRIVEKCKNEDGTVSTIFSNYFLGNAYTVVPKNSDEFKDILSRYPEVDPNSIHAVLCAEEAIETNEFFIQVSPYHHQLNEYSYYVMTEGGATFEKLETPKVTLD